MSERLSSDMQAAQNNAGFVRHYEAQHEADLDQHRQAVGADQTERIEGRR